MVHTTNLPDEDVIRISWEEFDNGARDIARQIARHTHEHHQQFQNIYGLPRGGLPLAVRLSYLLGVPLLTQREDVDASTLVVDDSTVTGKTLKAFCATHRNRTAVFVHKPDTSAFVPDFICKTTVKEVNYPWEAMDDRN